jgi:hypothetical protein
MAGDVGGPVAQLVVGVVARRADARPLDAYDPQPEPLGGAPRGRRHLTAGVGRAWNHRTSVPCASPNSR